MHCRLREEAPLNCKEVRPKERQISHENPFGIIFYCKNSSWRPESTSIARSDGFRRIYRDEGPSSGWKKLPDIERRQKTGQVWPGLCAGSQTVNLRSSWVIFASAGNDPLKIIILHFSRLMGEVIALHLMPVRTFGNCLNSSYAKKGMKKQVGR